MPRKPDQPREGRSGTHPPEPSRCSQTSLGRLLISPTGEISSTAGAGLPHRARRRRRCVPARDRVCLVVRIHRPSRTALGCGGRGAHRRRSARSRQRRKVSSQRSPRSCGRSRPTVRSGALAAGGALRRAGSWRRHGCRRRRARSKKVDRLAGRRLRADRLLEQLDNPALRHGDRRGWAGHRRTRHRRAILRESKSHRRPWTACVRRRPHRRQPDAAGCCLTDGGPSKCVVVWPA